MDFHHTLRALTPTLSDSALVLSGNSLCLGLKTFLSMYFRLGFPRTSFRTWFPSGVHQTPSDIFRTSLPGLEFRISFPFGRKEFNTLVSDFGIITSVLDLAPVLLSFGSRTQNLYRTSDSLPWLIKPWKEKSHTPCFGSCSRGSSHLVWDLTSDFVSGGLNPFSDLVTFRGHTPVWNLFQNFVPEVHHTSFRTLFVSRGSGDQHPVSDLWTSYPSFLYRTSDSLPWLIKPWKGNLTHHVSDLVPEDHHTSFGTSHRILFPGVSTPFRTL